MSGSPTGSTFTLGLNVAAGSPVPGAPVAYNAKGWQIRNSLGGVMGLTSDDFYVSSASAVPNTPDSCRPTRSIS